MVSPIGRLLIVDDEVELMHALRETLSESGFDCVGVSNPVEAVALLSSQRFDILLSDLMMPEMDGLQLLERAMAIDPALAVVLMTGQGSIPSAVESMKRGAFDYILKPFKLQVVLPVLKRAAEVRRLRSENGRLHRYVEQLTGESKRHEIVGSSPGIRRVLEVVEKVAPSDVTVLIRGPSGAGKELVARALHCRSRRRDRPLVAINCAAIQETLLESELFGYERGAFTGAVGSKPGLFEAAEGGTLFIDEVAEMPPSMQAKLLRVLENGGYRRVGAVKESFADVRVVAATNKSLEEERRAGRFREDLFYRLNVIAIDVPPLKDRREDIPELVRHFLATRQVARERRGIDDAALSALTAYPWPGNIRELLNVLERAQILAEGSTITVGDLPDEFAREHPAGPIPRAEPPGQVVERLAEVEAEHIRRILRKYRGNKVRAALALGISRRTLYRIIEKFNLDGGPGEPE